MLDPARDAAAALTELAHGLAPAVKNAMQVRAIRELTIKDDTASCYNRRYFEEFILEELSRANRFKTPMSLIFFNRSKGRMTALVQVQSNLCRWGINLISSQIIP